jgi:hypothetical protein
LYTNENILIKDSCILFDLLDLEILDDFFKLPFQVHTSIQVINEIEDELQMQLINKHIEECRLFVDKNGVYEVITAIITECPGLSFTDGSVLELAQRKRGTVLSADGSLRRYGIKQGLAVKGVLWVIEELYRQQIISVNEAINKLELYPKINTRTPKVEIAELIERLKGK